MSAQVISLAAFEATASATALSAAEIPERAAPTYRGPTYTTLKGDKFDPDRDLRDVAKLVRQDINAAVTAGMLPRGTKCSVRIERYSMGQALHVAVTACPIMLVNPAFVRWADANPHASWSDAPLGINDRMSPEGRHVVDTITGIVEAFNRRTTSDQADDYSNVAFYTHISCLGELLEEQRRAILALQPHITLRNAWKPAAPEPTGSAIPAA